MYSRTGNNANAFFSFLVPTDMVFTFNDIMKRLNVKKYLTNIPTTCRIGYNLVDMFKNVLFEFRDNGYVSLR